MYKDMVAQLTKPVEQLRLMSDQDMALVYAVMGVAGEVGEVCTAYTNANNTRFAPQLRLGTLDAFMDEAGDYLWYLTATCNALGKDLENYTCLEYGVDELVHELAMQTSDLTELVKKVSLNGKEEKRDSIYKLVCACYGILCSMVNSFDLDILAVEAVNAAKLRARLGDSYSDEKQAAKGELNG